jgi:hypothetical protein
VIAALVGLSSGPARAAPGDAETRKGLALAKQGQCKEAIPVLSEAEDARHRPSTALVLADCYAKTKDLITASDLYHALADEPPSRSHTAADRAAIKAAARKAQDTDARIPVIKFEVPAEYQGVEVTVNERKVEDLKAPLRVLPDVETTIVMRARGRQDHVEKIQLGEGEQLVMTVGLDPLSPSKGDKPAATRAASPRMWIGAGYRGYVIPRFVMNIFGDGGRTALVPGGRVTLTRPAGGIELAFSLGYAGYFVPAMPFKPKGTPDTEYEIVESNLQSLELTMDILWDVPLDRAGRFHLRVGGGMGIGYTFLGNLYRTQAYPSSLQPGDPYQYKKCLGPNDPPGSFRYCNQLDKDANHYNGFTEPSWFQGGARPLLYPWFALPELGLSFRPTPRLAIDLAGALSLSGFMTSIDARFAL